VNTHHICRLAAGLSAVLLLNSQLAAQSSQSDYPNKPINLVIPYAGDDSVSLEIRMYVNAIQETTGKRLVIDQRPGAGTTIGTAYVANASPDGYTALAINAPFAIAPAIYPNLSFDTLRDFAPVTLLSKKVYVLVVNPNSTFKAVSDYIAFAKENPTKLNFGTGGLGGAIHLPGELLHQMTNTKVTFIHYKKSNDRVIDLMAQRVDATLVSPLSGMAAIKAGKLRPIGVTSSQRIPMFPDLPTIAEQGVKDYEAGGWVGIVLPSKVAAPTVNKLNALFVQATKDPAVTKKLQSEASILIGSSTEQFRQHIAQETSRWRSLIKETGIKPSDD